VYRSIAAAALLGAVALAAVAPLRTAAAQPAPPPATSNVADCFDGACTVRLTGPVDIPLDGRFGPISLSITDIGPLSVTFELYSPSSGVGVAMVGQGGTTRFSSQGGTVAVRVVELAGETAVFELTSTPA
jgi:hypothetical protein